MANLGQAPSGEPEGKGDPENHERGEYQPSVELDGRWPRSAHRKASAQLVPKKPEEEDAGECQSSRNHGSMRMAKPANPMPLQSPINMF